MESELLNSLAEVIANWHWQRPLWLLCVPLILALAIFLENRTLVTGDWAEYIDGHLLSYLSLEDGKQSGHFGTTQLRLFAWISLVLAAIALAGPAWNKTEQPPLKNTARTIIVADMTMSMFANDVQPSRLVRLKFKLRELLKSIPDGELALVAYSGDAHIVSPLTDDYRAIDNLIPALSPEIFPAIGSNPETAFNLVTTLLENQSEGYNSVVLFTDEILESSERRIIEGYSNAIDQLIVVGVGSAQGGPIPLPSGRFLKDSQGNIVSAQLDGQRLTAFAGKANGRYLELSSDNTDIESILRMLKASAAGTQIDANTNRENRKITMDQWEDRGGYFALAIVPFFLCLFRRGYLLALVLSVTLTVLHSPQLQAQEPEAGLEQQDTQGESESTQELEIQPDKLWKRLWQNPNQRGATALEDNQTRKAAQTFRDPEWQSIAENRGGNYAKATQTINQILEQKDQIADKKAELLYNKGFNLAYAGDLQQASNTFADALSLREDFPEAEKAKAIVDQLLEQNEQNQNSQDNGSQDSDQQDSDQQDSDQQDGDSQQNDSQQDSSQNNDSQNSDSQSNSSEEDRQQQNSAQRSDQNSGEQQKQNQGSSEYEPSETNQNSNDTASEQNQQDVAQGADQKKEQHGESSTKTMSRYEQLSAAEKAELQSWLNQLTDDPGGLLRRKFDYERQVREREGTVIIDNEDNQLW